MVLNWKNFLNEDVNVKGLKKAVDSARNRYGDDGTFYNISDDLKKGGRKLKDVIENVADELGLEGKLKAYKGGAFGITFIWGEKTIKITTSKEEAKMTAVIMENQKKKKLDHIIKYDNVLKLKLKKFKSSKEYYVILMEKIIPLDSKKCPKDILNFYNDFLDHKFSYVSNIKEINEITNRILREVKKKKKEDYGNYVLDMASIIENYSSIGIMNDDIHAGNLGINSYGQLVSFDPMGSPGKSPRIKELEI